MQIETIDMQSAASELMRANNILLLCHKNPDGDTIGSATALMHALKNLGKTCAVICADEIPARYAYMQIDEFSNKFTPEYIIAIDTASLALLGNLPAEFTQKIDLCIDHHPSNTGYALSTLLDAKAAATAELMYNFILTFGTEITPIIADCLYTGVATDTGCFRFSNTSADTHDIAKKLIDEGANLEMLNSLLFESRSRSRIDLERMAYSSLEFFENDTCAVITLTLEELTKNKVEQIDLEGITAIPRSIEGVKAGITIRQIDDSTYKVSLRTTEGLNAAQICKTLGGGGHERAAGCEITGSLDKVKSAVLKEVLTALNG